MAIEKYKADYAVHRDRHYPKALMLKVPDCFFDEDGIEHRFPAHTVIRNPYNILILVNRKANYVEVEKKSK